MLFSLWMFTIMHENISYLITQPQVENSQDSHLLLGTVIIIYVLGVIYAV